MNWNWPKIRTIAFGILAGVVASAGTIAVTVAGFALSYDAIRAVGIASRIRTEWAWLLPVSVDGAMAVGTIAAVVLRRMTGKTAVYPWVVVLIGAAISIACNGLHAIPPAGAELVIPERWVRFAVSAIPAVMLALSVHLLVTLVEAASVFGAGEGDAPPQRPADAPADKPADAPAPLPVTRPAPVVTQAVDAAPAAPSGAPASAAPKPAQPAVTRFVTQADALPRRTREVVMRRPVSAPPADRDAAMAQALDAVLKGGASIRGAARDADVPEASLRREVNKRREATQTNGHQFELAGSTTKGN
ncbi:DUF2637 domain-containing protein [Micromonospora sp. NPDC047465]|uniref:DUF2637 domain-containing protein n=1 Tax=Micromonospora sp. NPDC047465 TaxID=3154813 RepID=UPI0033D745EC